MMITSIAGFKPARTQNFGAKLTHDINDYLKKIPADEFQKTDTSEAIKKLPNIDSIKKNFLKPAERVGTITWTLDHLDSLQLVRNYLQNQVKSERMKYGYAKNETLRAYNRYDYIFKQVQKKGTFTETPDMFK